MVIDQFPGAQLGQEPQVLQKLRTGDVDFAITSTANSATVQPESGVFSIHFVFRSEDHLKKALADPAVVAAFTEMMNSKVEGAHTLALGTMGFRDIYSKHEIHRGKQHQRRAAGGHPGSPGWSWTQRATCY
jgi:TRAP-type C4-dicarboxylate transport system substrate-binding protein